MEGIRPVRHVVEGRPALLTIQQHAYALRTRISQHRLDAVVPGRQLAVEPLHAPGAVITAQTTGGALTVDAAVGQPKADEVVAAQPDLPVVATSDETWGGEHLGANRKAFWAFWVVGGLI